MKFSFFTVMAAFFAAYHVTEAAIHGGKQQDQHARAIWAHTAPYPGLLLLFKKLGIAMTPKELSSYIATLTPESQEFILRYLSEHYSKQMDDNLKVWLRFGTEDDKSNLKSEILHILASRIMEHEDTKTLAIQKGLDTTNVETLVKSLKYSLKGLLA